MHAAAEPLLERRSARGRIVLTAVTLGSAVAFLDGTVVNIALPTIGRDLGATFEQLQWVVNGYMLSLSSLILLAGSLGDRQGRRRIYAIGVSGFALASLLCASAQTPEQLIAARLLQGIGGALLTPGALAIIQASFRKEDRPAVIGVWAGVSGVSGAFGFFVAGWVIDHLSWRWIFWVNVPLCVAVLVLTRYIPESRDEEAGGRFDVLGAVLISIGLGGTTLALTGSWSVRSVLLGVMGLAALVAFVLAERRNQNPLVPLRLFASRIFSSANAMTFLVYGALGSGLFLLTIQLQVTSGYSPLLAGFATLPITVALLALSPSAARLSQRIGPRIPMSVGPWLCAVGVVLLAFVDDTAPYVPAVLPGVVIFALGLALLVSPLTSTVLAAAPDRFAGVASAINNAVARSGSLLAVAAVPTLAGISGADYRDPVAFTDGYLIAQLVTAALLAGGGTVCWFGLPRGAVDT